MTPINCNVPAFATHPESKKQLDDVRRRNFRPAFFSLKKCCAHERPRPFTALGLSLSVVLVFRDQSRPGKARKAFRNQSSPGQTFQGHGMGRGEAKEGQREAKRRPMNSGPQVSSQTGTSSGEGCTLPLPRGLTTFGS